MRSVAAHSDVPVPQTYWAEQSPAILGGEFFVMERADGDVPPDVMPYNFGSWLSEANPEQRARLQHESIKVLADLHAIPLSAFDFLNSGDQTSALRRHVTEQRHYYEWVAKDARRSPLIEQGFDWLDEHWPSDEGPTVPCWGDARIGNIMYREFTPVAVLDWEMATLGPREMDLGWMIFLHRFFEDLANAAGLPGMPEFLRRKDVTETYLALTGHQPQNLDFFTLYAALRHAAIMYRIQSRAVAFGHAEPPDDPDDMILHSNTLAAMIDGTYWPSIDGGAPR